ncbi:hypothetical protein BH24ACI5_BH24ACI5_09970 [soil metagenome]
MKALLCAGFFALGTVAMAAQDSKLGTGVSLTEATPIKALVNHPEDFVGKTVRIDGVATAVCESMGCWLAISTSDAKDADTIRVKVEDGVIVFPVTAKGKQVSAEGVFEEVTVKAGQEAAAEHAAHHPPAKPDPKAKPDPHAAHAAPATHHATEPAAAAAKKYQIKATGAIVR